MKTVLLLGDITGRSRVALRMLCAVLERRGHEVLMLPTALISNTLNLGRHAALDTTDYLLRSLDVWQSLNLHIDLAYIGYITGEEQAQKLCAVADGLRARGVKVVLDPILGDSGRMYNSVSEGQAAGLALLREHCDLMTPNMTEACLLTGTPYEGADCRAMAQQLGNVLITGAKTQGGGDAVIGMENAELFEIPFERVPGHHWGTGDLFTGLMMDGLLGGKSIRDAAADAAGGVSRQLKGEEESLLPEQ